MLMRVYLNRIINEGALPSGNMKILVSGGVEYTGSLFIISCRWNVLIENLFRGDTDKPGELDGEAIYKARISEAQP